MDEHPLVLFDGVCNYCNSLVNFAIRNDRKGQLRFAPLQSNTGKEIRGKYGVPPSIDTVLMVDDGKLYTYSEAALRVARYLDWPARLLRLLVIIPLFIRQPVYRYIARNRYKWFGKKEQCMIPDAAVRSRFVD